MDHKPVVSAFCSSNIPKSDKQKTQLALISEYVSRIEYIKGDGNILADCLSALASAQVEGVELLEYKHGLTECELSPNVTILCK